MLAPNGIYYKNAEGLPQPYLKAIAAENYDGPSIEDMATGRILSVTSLINPPKILQLLLRQKREGSPVSRDISDDTWKLLGKAVHYILENGFSPAPGAFSERRMQAAEPLYGTLISGQIDHFDGSIIWDYKVTSTYSLNSPHDSWEKQLNVYAWILDQFHINTEGLKIVAILRDWGPRLSNISPRPVAVLPIRLWEKAQREGYVTERVAMHRAAFDTIPPCTDEERWKRGNSYARCERYCDVASICDQYRGNR